MKFLNLFKLKIDNKRVFGLDILRFFAIMFVVISHGLVYLPKEIKEFLEYFIFDGVTIFFVLSGFLIGGILIKILNNGSFTINKLFDFWKRRWFRTLPAYFLILILLVLININFNDKFVFDYNIFKYFLFIQNFKSIHPNFFPEAWSLSVEEWFYLLSPICIFFLINVFKLKSKKAILFTILLITLFTTGFRAYRFFFNVNLVDINIFDIYYRKQVITRLDSLMYGVLGAFIKFYYERFFYRYKNILFIAGIIGAIIHRYTFVYYDFNQLYYSVFSFPLISISTLFLLPLLDSIKTGTKIILKPITYISLTSYSMYLINLSLIQMWIIDKIQFLNKPVFLNSGITFTIFLILVISISILMYKYFELPTTKLRDIISKKTSIIKSKK